MQEALTRAKEGLDELLVWLHGQGPNSPEHGGPARPKPTRSRRHADLPDRTRSARADRSTRSASKGRQEAISEKAKQSIVDNEGVTINVGGLQPSSGYAFAPSKETEEKIAADAFTWEAVDDYIERHWKALQEADNFLGGWVHEGNVYLDVSTVLDDQAAALERAAASDQIAIFDLGTFSEINVKEAMEQDIAAGEWFRGLAPISLTAVHEHDNGDVETEVDILELVPQEHGLTGPFHATEKHAGEMIGNAALERSLGYEPPLVAGHGADDTDPTKVLGWIKGLERVGTRLKMKVRILADKVKHFRPKGGGLPEIRYVSPEFQLNAKSSTGASIGAKLFRVATTATPHQKGADGLPVGQFALSAFTPPQESETMTVTLEDVRKIAGEAVTAATAELEGKLTKLSEQLGDIVKLGESTGGEAKSLAELQADVVALSKSIDEKVQEATTKLSEELADAQKEVKEIADARHEERTLIFLEEVVGDGRVFTKEFGERQEDWREKPLEAFHELGYRDLASARAHFERVESRAPNADPESHGGPGDEKGQNADELEQSVRRIYAEELRGGMSLEDATADYKERQRVIKENRKAAAAAS